MSTPARPFLPRKWSATVIGFVVIDADGHGHMCDDLKSDRTACRSPSIAVDWATGNATPPDALVTHGSARVSATL